MKRVATTIGLVGLLLVAATVNAQQYNATGKIGVGFDGGLMLPSSGDITQDSSLSDFYKLGPGFGIHATYGIIPGFSVRAGLSYAFMKMEDEPAAGRNDDGDPYFTAPYLYLDGVCNLGGVLGGPQNPFNPYLLAGGGLYFWKASKDGVTGNAFILTNGEQFKKTSPGLNFGGGFEYFATPQLSLFAESKYHLVFAKDEDKFGTDYPDFDNLGLLDISAGLTYHFPVGAK